MKKISQSDPVQQLIPVRAKAHATLTANVGGFVVLVTTSADVAEIASHTVIARDLVVTTVDVGSHIMDVMLDVNAVDQAVDAGVQVGVCVIRVK